MKIEELAERYKKELPNTETELEFIRAVCIKLGKEHSFDTRYYLGNSQTRRDIYRMAKRSSEEIGSIVGNRTIICVSLSYKMKALFAKFGYDIEIPLPNDGDDHVYPIITLHDGKKMKIDVQLDLEKIQTGCATSHFGTKEIDDPQNLYTISDNELKLIDKKIGYIKDEYRDAEIGSLYNEIKNKTVKERLRILLHDYRTSELPPDIQYVEQNKYYFALLRMFFSLAERNKIFLVTCYKKDLKNERQYTNCVLYHSTSKDDNPDIYIFSEKENRYSKISTEELKKMKKNGLNIGIGLHERGTNILLRMLKQIPEKKQNEELEI